jgi:Peptidase MA superfamily/Omp85 superfamily domain/WD40-like Beta Propeller Repeat
MRKTVCSLKLKWIGTVLVLLFSVSLHAQYFGQNKVRYKTFDFQVLKTEHFDIYYYKEEAGAATQFGRMAERWYDRYQQVLGWQLSGRQALIVYANSQDFRSTTVIPGEIGEGTGGVTESLRRRIVMPMAGPLAETDHVLGHELVHAYQYDITSGPNGPGINRMPLWFVEGMAEYLSVGPVDPNTAMWMRDAVLHDKLPAIKDLDNPRYFPYRWGQALWAYLGGRYGDKVVAQMLKDSARAGSVKAVIQGVLKTDLDVISNQWHDALKQQYEPVLHASVPAGDEGKVLVSKEKHGGELNVSPSLSPDGKLMAFFSSKDLFSIDLFLADAQTGEIKRRLTNTATSPHVESLQFITSAGAWSKDGRQLAYGRIGGGRAELVIDNIDNGDSRKIRFDSLGEIYNPTWSPDGQSIAFSANAGGLTDLYLVNVKTRQLRRLTNDAFADLEPAWSPDGSRIALVTDRFSSNLDNLSFGNYQLALLDPKTGDMQLVHTFQDGKSTNPQWSPDGRSLFFLSDRTGKSDIYRIDLADGNIHQVTNLQTGVTGITSLSPAFSVAENANRLVYSMFRQGDYTIYGLDSGDLAGYPPKDMQNLDAGVLPPGNRIGEEVASLLRSPEKGLVAGKNFETTDYRPSLALDYIAPPTVGVGFSSYGSEIAGGTALYFSDMLGFHNLAVNLQTSTLGDASNFLKNFGATATYQNDKHRWTWGLTGGQIPYLTGSFGQGLVDLGGGQVGLAQQQITYWQIDRQVAGLLAYPFNRAQRLEFTGGYQNISFAGQAEVDVIDPTTGQLIGRSKQDINAPSSLNMGTFSTALVYDTSIFGGTSPVAGQRYRFEIGGNAGTINFGTLLLDYRKYVRLGPFTLAGRGFHYGRYGGGAQDPRLQDLFLGYSSLIRGYDPNSFSLAECGSQVQQTGACPAFDRLLGSRIAVGNAELRLPLFGPLGVIYKNFLPIGVAPFYDVGVAWDRGNRPSFFGGTAATGHSAVSSYGGSLRINIFGYAVGEVSLVHPNDRPTRNWMWQFSLIPGF